MINAYAQPSDAQAYSPGVCGSLNESQLTTLIQLAQFDLDHLVLPPAVLTASQQRLTTTGTITGGTFGLIIPWINGRTYAISGLPHDVTANELISAMNLMVDQWGFALPSQTCWQLPPDTPDNLAWPTGPLSVMPIDVQAASDFDEQDLPLLTVDDSELTGGGSITATEIVCGGLKIDPTWLLPRQITALNRATCAQVEYRQMMGPNFYVRAQFDSISGPVFHTQGKLPLIGPKVRQELAQSGLLLIGARASKGKSRRPSGMGLGWPAYHPPVGGSVW